MAELDVSQINEYCETTVSNCRTKFPEFHPFFESLFLFGLRAVELIELWRWTRYSKSLYRVDTAKKSPSRFINIDDVPATINEKIENGLDYIYPFLVNYQSSIFKNDEETNKYLIIYNFLMDLFNQCKPISSLHCKDKPIQLHIFRHNRIKQLYFIENWLVSEISQWIGEASDENTMMYINSNILKPE